MNSTYITTNRLRALAELLSEREWSVLTSLHRVRVATSVQLEALHFTDITRRQARQTLSSMVDRRLLARLPRRVGGVRSGSAGFVYVLDVAGLRLTRPTSPLGSRRPWAVGRLFLAHSLAVTDVFVSLATHAMQPEVDVELVRFRTEPDCWRTFVAAGGARGVLKPDADVLLRTGRYEDHWLLEIDRATESRPTLARKLARYVDYWQTGQEQHGTGVFPKVLWVVPDLARHGVLVDEFSRLPVDAWPLFTVITEPETVARILAGAGS